MTAQADRRLVSANTGGGSQGSCTLIRATHWALCLTLAAISSRDRKISQPRPGVPAGPPMPRIRSTRMLAGVNTMYRTSSSELAM